MKLTFAQKVKAIRAVLNLSQEGMASTCEVGRNTIRDWENGRVTPNPNNFKRLIRKFPQIENF